MYRGKKLTKIPIINIMSILFRNGLMPEKNKGTNNNRKILDPARNLNQVVSNSIISSSYPDPVNCKTKSVNSTCSMMTKYTRNPNKDKNPPNMNFPK